MILWKLLAMGLCLSCFSCKRIAGVTRKGHGISQTVSNKHPSIKIVHKLLTITKTYTG
jgi:hypothetical protein